MIAACDINGFIRKACETIEMKQERYREVLNYRKSEPISIVCMDNVQIILKKKEKFMDSYEE